MAVDKVIIEYQLKTDQLRKELDDVKSQINSVDTTATKSANNLSATFLKVGGAIAAAFSVQQIIQFAAKADELARKAEGIERAFGRLNDANLLQELRKATQGAVSDLNLMQSAVRAANFKLPLDQLAKMFAFASQRARETGDSVDYLVESIVLGISRKSIPILDNLGISAVQIQEEFQKTGDFAVAVGNIIDQSMSQGTDATDNMALAADRAKANLENLTLEIGKRLTPALTTLRVGLNAAIESVIDLFDPAFITQREAAVQSTEDMILRIEKAGVISQVAQGRIDRFNEKIADLDTQLKNTTNVKARQELINQLTAFGKAMIAVNEEDASKSLAATDKGMRAAGLGIQEANSFIANYLSTLSAGEEVQDNLTASTKKLDASMSQFAENHKEENPSGVDYMLQQLLKSYQELSREVTDILPDLSKQEDIFNEIGFSGLALNPVVQNLTAAYKEGRLTLEQYADAIKDIIVAQNEAGVSSDNLAEKQSQNQEAALQIAQAVGEFRGALWQKETDDYIAQLDAQLAAGKISQETFDRLSSEALAENAKKQKEAAMFDIIIKTAQAVIALLAQGNVAGSLAAGITGALQLAVVSGAPIPAFAEGVVDLKGKGTETSDEILARLSRGESVITARGTRQDKGLFEAANKMQLEEYINKNYVLPVLLKKQSEQQSAFDDYRLWLATMSNGKKMEKGNKEIVKAIKQTGFNQRRYWA